MNRNINNRSFFFILILFLFLQITFLPQMFYSWFAVPNIILILLISAAFIDKTQNIFYLSFFIGFILDVFSDVYFGPIISSVLLSIFIVSYLGKRFVDKLSSLNIPIVSALGVFIYNALYIVISNIENFEDIQSFFGRIFVVSSIDIIFAVILVYPLVYLISTKSNEK